MTDLHRNCFTVSKYFKEVLDWEAEKVKDCVCDIYKLEDVSLQIIQAVINDIKQVDVLRALPLIPQRSKEWYDLRMNRLTASDLAQSMGKGKFGNRQQLLEKKAFPETNVMNNDLPPLKWGVMFEEMGMRCYKQGINNVEIYEFGLIPHNEIGCFGASPDGITETGIMVEMKCPYKRKCTNDIPEQYFLQIQGQLATCGLTACDYVECYFEVYHELCEYAIMCEKSEKTEHGIILEFMDNESKNYAYEYSPEYFTYQECIEWANISVSKFIESNPNHTFLKMTAWKLKNMFNKRVEFDKMLWDSLVPNIYQFWKDVEALRIAGLQIKEKKVTSPAKRTLNLITEIPVAPKAKYVFLEDSDEE